MEVSVEDMEVSVEDMEDFTEDMEVSVEDMEVSDVELIPTTPTMLALFLASTNAILIGDVGHSFTLDMAMHILIYANLLICLGITIIVLICTLLNDAKLLAIK
jgi:hypothetical protein